MGFVGFFGVHGVHGFHGLRGTLDSIWGGGGVPKSGRRASIMNGYFVQILGITILTESQSNPAP